MTAAGRALDRLEPAAADARAVISAPGLLAPFNDGGVLSPLDVHAAAAAARLCGEADPRVVLAAALAVRGARLGNVCIDLAAQRGAVAVDGQDPEAVDALPWPDPDGWTEAVESGRMAGGGGEGRPLVMEGGRLYLDRYFRYEDRVAGLIESRAAAPPDRLDPDVEAALDRLLPPVEGGAPNLQHRAARTALTGRFTVIAGGPGTGKTYTVAALLAALAHLPAGRFPRAALCAPTGKAAARLGEVVAEFAAGVDDPVVRERLMGLQAGASTIHRLLGWAWGRGRFEHHERNRLLHDLVIVDEMSMVSLPLAAKLLSAVRDEASVVLVGDPYQLESIEAGTVLADIAVPAAGGGPDPRPGPDPPIAGRVVVLERGHRYAEGGPIADFADAVRLGDADLALELLGGGHEGVDWIEERSASGFAPLWERLIDGRSRLVKLAKRPGGGRKALEQLGKTAVLCAHREGPGSVAQWRRDIESALDERFPGLRYGGPWYPGRPVMITNNDYDLGLYNGDIGVAAWTVDGLRAVFDRGGAFPPGYLGEHATVHAMTIHKSQGSQFGEVLVSLPPASSRLLTRELLYTAVTRASESVTLIGGESVIRRAVERSVQRASGLGPRLWNQTAAPSPPPSTG